MSKKRCAQEWIKKKCKVKKVFHHFSPSRVSRWSRLCNNRADVRALRKLLYTEPIRYDDKLWWVRDANMSHWLRSEPHDIAKCLIYEAQAVENWEIFFRLHHPHVAHRRRLAPVATAHSRSRNFGFFTQVEAGGAVERKVRYQEAQKKNFDEKISSRISIICSTFHFGAANKDSETIALIKI